MIILLSSLLGVTWSEWSVNVWRHCLVATSQTFTEKFNLYVIFAIGKFQCFIHLDTAITAARHKVIIVRAECNTKYLKGHSIIEWMVFV